MPCLPGWTCCVLGLLHCSCYRCDSSQSWSGTRVHRIISVRRTNGFRTINLRWKTSFAQKLEVIPRLCVSPDIHLKGLHMVIFGKYKRKRAKQQNYFLSCTSVFCWKYIVVGAPLHLRERAKTKTLNKRCFTSVLFFSSEEEDFTSQPYCQGVCSLEELIKFRTCWVFGFAFENIAKMSRLCRQITHKWHAACLLPFYRQGVNGQCYLEVAHSHNVAGKMGSQHCRLSGTDCAPT